MVSNNSISVKNTSYIILCKSNKRMLEENYRTRKKKLYEKLRNVKNKVKYEIETESFELTRKSGGKLVNNWKV